MAAEIRAVTAWDFEISFGRLTPVVSNPDQVAQKVCSETAIKAFGSTPPPTLELMTRKGPANKVLVDESRQPSY